jgi:thiamine biosynthesis lipoprotein
MTPTRSRISTSTHIRSAELLGEHVRLDVRDLLSGDLVAHATRQARDELVRIDRRLARERDDSELSELVAEARDLTSASQELVTVLDACAGWSRLTRGAFDISRGCAPEDLNPARYVRGYAADRALEVLAAHSVSHACVSVGGDVVVRGTPEAGRPWRAGVRSGRAGEPVRAVVSLEPSLPWRAVATDEREDGTVFAVVAHNLTVASTLATALAHWDRRGTPWVSAPAPTEVLRIDPAGAISGSHVMHDLLKW